MLLIYLRSSYNHNMDMIKNYNINIYERYKDLKKSNKPELDNFDLCKIFEYYTCNKLSEEYKKPFYEYNDIEPKFKELNNMSIRHIIYYLYFKYFYNNK